MSSKQPYATRRALHDGTRHRKRTRRTRAWLLLLFVVILIGSLGWIGIRGLTAKSDLETAQALIGRLQSEIADLNVPSARKTFSEISQKTASARELTSDPVWRAGEYFPWLGKNLTVVREIAGVTDDVMTGVGGPLVDVAENINPASFAPKDGAIDLAPFQEAAPVLVDANTRVTSALAAASRIDADGTIAPVAKAKTKFVSLLGGIAPVNKTLSNVVPLLPTVLGAEEPRTYVVMFQNNAESRPLGGTALSFALLKIDHGKIGLEKSFPTGMGNFGNYPGLLASIEESTLKVFPDLDGVSVPNVTSRPSFTTAAEITNQIWVKQFGTKVDGIISVDPVALSHVLRATTPIKLDSGDMLTSTSLVPLLLNGVYLRYTSGTYYENDLAQNAIYNEAVDATFKRLTNGPLDSKKLITALLQGWNEQRILYWSAHPDEEAALAELGLNGEPPISDAKTDRVGVYFQDDVVSKLNYYLKTAVQLSQARCVEGQQNYRVSVDLVSTLAPDQVKRLPLSILGDGVQRGIGAGVQRMFVYLYAPPGSTIIGATVDGTPVTLESLHDVDYPVGRLRPSVNPGATVHLTYDVTAPGTTVKKLEAKVTPMVNPTTVTTKPLDCSTVAAPAAP